MNPPLISERVFKGVVQKKMIRKMGFEMTHSAFVFTLIMTFSVYLLSGANPLYSVSFFPIAVLCVLVERKEPRMFRLLRIWLLTVSRGGFRAMLAYGASTRAPLSYARGPRRRRTII